MNTRRVIPEAVTTVQLAASDPSKMAWVSANAGSGKTHVLAQRVIRLLLDGVDPSRILCITFTKAAAANMANRVFDDLRKWIALDDAALDRAMRTIGVRDIDNAQRARARRLFALALETPGGLKVQTIHAFCTRLLHLFPVEANVAARFSVLDEATETRLLDQLTLGVLLEAAGAPETALGRALAAAIVTSADKSFRDAVRDAISQRDKLTAWIDAAGDVPTALAQLSHTLGIEPGDSLDKVEAEFFEDALIAPSEWSAVAAALAQGSKNDQQQAERFRALAELAGGARTGRYIEVFCTAELLPRKSLVTKAIQTAHPGLFQQWLDEQQRVCALLVRRRAIAARERTASLVIIADAVIGRFRLEKDRRGLLDYEDLIDKTVALMSNVSASWVHYKLDRGIDHVLIDEAQDTSPKQWSIVRALVAEFFAGAGARTARRTIFAVGDEKQSIFSFQGAEPRAFEEMHREFHRLSEGVERKLHFLRFAHSFRSGANVLAAVDQVFAPQKIAASISTDRDGPAPHIALPEATPGVVEIWDTEKPADKRDMEGWDAPFDTVTETSPSVRLAGRIAASISAWRRQGARPRDILVLVRRRGALFEAIIRAMKNEGIPVAGADRLVLTEHIAVMDLMVLADALLLPQDDLALATVLKSPLFGLDDDALFKLAWNRDGISLIAALRAAAAGDVHLSDTVARLDRLAASARRETPFAFYAGLLGAERGRQRMLARLGHEAADALDEFLNLALDYERSETPSLQGFVAWLRAAKAEVKRDMEVARDEVRVMTVHGAKGLEAPIVILADTTTPPQGWHPAGLLPLPPQDAAPGAPSHLVWAGAKAADVACMTEAREGARANEENEYRRLLYVAMTRAAEKLVVCGIEGDRKRPAGCWYDLVSEALLPEATEEPADAGGGTVWRYRKVPAGAATLPDAEPPPKPPVALPAWLSQPAPPEPALVPALAPSSAYDDTVTAHGAAAANPERKAALLRGTLVHRLLQSLPEIAPAQRAEAAFRFLRNKDLPQADAEALAAEVLRLIDDPRFAPLFATGSRAEVAIAGRLGARAIHGTVDRLTVSPEAVLIADYKTNRPAPRDAAEALRRYPAYIAQLALYRAVLARLYPDRPVRAALLWTETPQLMELSPAMLDEALATLTSP